MADAVTIDTSEFDRAIAQLARISDEARPLVRKAVQVNVTKVKEAWREKLQGTPSAPRVPYSITYDTKELAGGVEAEIGATKGTGNQGGVALLLEYGAPNNPSGLPAHGYGLASLQENVEDLEYGVGEAIDGAVKAVGL
ncbi:hypothetical protein [Curtobacterium sp. DN_7.5]|uniref:hypothetical protein n=1 Tax=Curtobacterium sp. DN_7.5 TaxID=3049047 RepID=UPI001F56C8EA|nr:hypothetical protein [Curtobacterium sp. DN_7.5]